MIFGRHGTKWTEWDLLGAQRLVCRTRESLWHAMGIELSKNGLYPSVQYQDARPISRWGLFFARVEGGQRYGLAWLASQLTMCESIAVASYSAQISSGHKQDVGPTSSDRRGERTLPLGQARPVVPVDVAPARVDKTPRRTAEAPRFALCHTVAAGVVDS